MKTKKINGFTILNEPEPYKLTDYYEVRDSVVDVFKKIPGLLSIYQMGSISAPGISDLDLILVFDDSVENIDYRQYYDKMDKRTRYILMHPPFAIARSLYYNMRYFYVPQNFKLLFGEDQPIKSIPNSNFLYKIVSIEFVLGLLFAAIRSRHSMVIKVRSMMNGLYSIKYDLAVFQTTKNAIANTCKYIENLTALRNNWFQSSKQTSLEEFIDLLLKSPDTLICLLQMSEKRITEYIYTCRNNINHLVSLGINEYLTASTDNDCRYVIGDIFFSKLLRYLSFSTHIDDARWIFTDYKIQLPEKLLSIFINHDIRAQSNIFNKKSYYTQRYLNFVNKVSGFCLLLPPIRSKLQMDSIKWQSLRVAKRILMSIK